MSTHKGHSSWFNTETDRLSFDSGGLGKGCSGEMIGGGAMLLILEMIILGVTPGMWPLPIVGLAPCPMYQFAKGTKKD